MTEKQTYYGFDEGEMTNAEWTEYCDIVSGVSK